MKTAAIDRYNCDRDGEPPYCELALKAVSDTETPPDLSLTVTLFGAKNPNTIILNRVAMTPEGVPRPVPDGAISTANSEYFNIGNAIELYFCMQAHMPVKCFTIGSISITGGQLLLSFL